MECVCNNSVYSFTRKLHITSFDIRLSERPDIIVFAYALALSLMSHNRSIITNRIMFLFVEAFFSLSEIVKFYHNSLL